jgi:hypothetical protein
VLVENSAAAEFAAGYNDPRTSYLAIALPPVSSDSYSAPLLSPLQILLVSTKYVLPEVWLLRGSEAYRAWDLLRSPG